MPLASGALQSRDKGKMKQEKDINKCKIYIKLDTKMRYFSVFPMECKHLCDRATQMVDLKRPINAPNTTFGTAVSAQLHTWPEGAA